MRDNLDDILVIRPDFACILVSQGHQIVALKPKRYKNSNLTDKSRCVFYFKKDNSICKDLENLIKESNSESQSL